jgi:glycosyltransferase involved in cell wall biosynthesis
MSQHNLISIVTVCYNSAITILRTIDSVREQTYPNIEYLVIDGGSTDGTVDIIRANGDVVTDWVSEPDRGIYDAMNKGVCRARGEWIHILNSDDFYAGPDVLEKAVPMLDPGRTNYFAMWRQFEEGRRELQNWHYRRWPLFVSAFLPHPGLIVSRAQYGAAGLYDTRYRIAADHDMILRLTSRWPGLGHAMPLTVMAQGGYSEENMLTALQEFKGVTMGHGLPLLMASGFYWLKRLWWRI